MDCSAAQSRLSTSCFRTLSKTLQTPERCGSIPDLKSCKRCRMGTFPLSDWDWCIYTLTRPLIEQTLRRRVERHTNITLRGGCRALDIMGISDELLVTGVRYDTGNGVVILPADLVVDASELSPRTFCTFAREFSPFTARGCSWATSDSGDGFGRVVERPHDPFPPSPQKRTGPRALRSCVPSAVGGHAAVSRDGHVRQAADRLAPARARRAVSAPDVRSAGTASPVPKYISSGVCPLNAECGSTRLCSST